MASMAAASATESKLLKRDTMLNDLEDLDPGTLNKVNDFVDDDLLSCFLWAAGENAVAQRQVGRARALKAPLTRSREYPCRLPCRRCPQLRLT